MSISINYPSGHILGEVKNIRVTGLPGVGSYTLVIHLHFLIHSPKSETFFNNLSIRIDWGDNRQRMLGSAVSDESQPITIPQSPDKTICFRMLVSKHQLEAIESLRNGGDFPLSIWLTGNVIQNDRMTNIYQHDIFTVKQHEWVEALESMEYCRTFLFELPIPFIDDEKEPVDHIIKKAQNHMLRGQYDECVSECRKLLEVYALDDSDKKLLTTAREKYKGTQDARQSMEIPERLLILREALVHTTHPAHHHSNDDGYSRDQARAILGSTISLMPVFSETDSGTFDD